MISSANRKFLEPMMASYCLQTVISAARTAREHVEAKVACVYNHL